MDQNNTKKQWDERIDSYRQSGLSLTKWCEANDISEYAMRYHLYKAPDKAKKDEPDTVAFIPAAVVDTEPEEIKSSSIVLNIGSVTLSVDHATDLKLLKKIIRVLQS